MRAIIILLLFSTTIMWYGCSRSYITGSWKMQGQEAKKNTNILVAAIIKDVPLRKQVEEHFVAQLQSNGYRSGSAMKEYGPYGLGKFSQEQTYVALCNNGYDAVLTIVLIDKEKEKRAERKERNSSNTYYYNRVWNYSHLQANPADSANKVYWEAVLFDLHTLETRYKVQTKLLSAAKLQNLFRDHEKAIIKNMLKKKVLIKQESNTEKPKTF